jgi:hypothetical protein
MVNQRYFTKVEYDGDISNDLFDPDHVITKQKK